MSRNIFGPRLVSAMQSFRVTGKLVSVKDLHPEGDLAGFTERIAQQLSFDSRIVQIQTSVTDERLLKGHIGYF